MRRSFQLGRVCFFPRDIGERRGTLAKVARLFCRVKSLRNRAAVITCLPLL